MAQETPTIEVPPDLLEKARTARWPLDLVRTALQYGASADDLARYMDSGVTPRQARAFMVRQFMQQTPQLNLDWMKVPTEFVHARKGAHGLTLDAINIGKYGVVPDTWEYMTEMPRGAVPISGVESMGYTIYEKHEVWADNAAALYEEAIQRRWRPATDIPWASLRPLPDDIERALCQICTNLSERAQVETDVLARWEPEISYGYHEIKLYLATVIFEGARAVDAFRKRALANGGGLGRQSSGWMFRAIADARNFTEMVVAQMVIHDSFTLTEYAFAEKLARNPADKKMLGLAMQDKARHVAYGLSHLKYTLQQRPERRGEIGRYFAKGETALAADDEADATTRDAWAVLLGGGTREIQRGRQLVDRMRRRQVQDYLARLKAATIDRDRAINQQLKVYIDY